MSTITEHIDVEAPIGPVYDRWTRFERFPEFMEGVEEVRQLDDRRLHWKAKIAGVEREWDAEITEQHPEERVAWKSTSGLNNAGVVTFHKLDPTHTRVTLQQDVEAEGAAEKAADALGGITRQAKNDLSRFAELMRDQGGPAEGGWRGDVPREG
ncbi:MAG: SRPBCC family protein [Baekduia sp.]